MQPINQTASMVNLAKTVLASLDRHSAETTIRTETLRLLAETLIELGTPAYDMKIGKAAASEVVARKVKIDGVT